MTKQFVLLISLCGLSGCQHYDPNLPPAPSNSDSDPPELVARLSYIQGPVSFKAAGTEEWVSAVLNRPLTVGDELWTDKDARAELSIGSAAIRLDAQTSISFLNLDDKTVQFKLTEGLVGIHVRSLEGIETMEVDTPSAAITLLRSGDYRVEVRPDTGATRIMTRAGMADVSGAAQPFVIRPNQEAIVSDKNAITEPQTAPPLDAFDQYCETRERRTERAASLQHIPQRVIGWEDLDEYGAWETYPEYGPVWSPRVIAPGWVPYRFGHWVWIEPWGWTWVDDAPWGFAPFHYGRWVFIGVRWCWVPGPIRPRVVYAPALVVFVGGGPNLRYHVRVGMGVGIGWFPLGPGEVYIPPYRASRVYVTNINISHHATDAYRTDMIRQNYINRRHSGAITTVPEDTFVNGRKISQAVTALSDRDAAAARVIGTTAPVSPTLRSVTGDPEQRGRVQRPPDAATRRPVVVRQTPAPQKPAFEQNRAERERDPGRPSGARTGTAQPTPEYRRIPQSPKPPDASPQRQPPPRMEQQRQDRRMEDRTRSESERRRRTIDQEHQRQPAPARPDKQRKAEPEGRKRPSQKPS